MYLSIGAVRTSNCVLIFHFQVSSDELKQAAELLLEALFIRAKYMALSMQSFCPTTAHKMKTVHSDYDVNTQFALKKEPTSDSEGKGLKSQIFLFVFPLKSAKMESLSHPFTLLIEVVCSTLFIELV